MSNNSSKPKGPRKDWKHLSENYDQHIDEHLPEEFHRGDFCTTNRLLGYADAMMATCGTFLVLPLRNLKEKPTDISLSDYMGTMSGELVMFVMGFLIICTMWESYNVRSILVKRLDDILVIISQFQMFLVCVLPFSIALQGHFPEEKSAIFYTIILLVIHEALHILFIGYAYASPILLHFALRNLKGQMQRRAIFFSMLEPLSKMTLVIIAGLLCLVDFKFSWVLLGCLILYPLARKSLIYYRRHTVNQEKFSSELGQFYIFFSKGNVSGERVEAMTDAAVAIIACVLILDITVEEFPKDDDVKAHGLASVLDHMRGEFIAFINTYTKVSALWFLNHSTLQLFHTIDIVTLYLQKLFLVVLSLTPFYASMHAHYVRLYPKEGDAQTAILFGVGIYVFASGIQLLMILWATHKKEKLAHKWAVTDLYGKNSTQHTYLILKTLVLIFWATMSFIGTFGTLETCVMISNINLYTAVPTFIIIKFMFANNIGRKHNIKEDIHGSPDIPLGGREDSFANGLCKESQEEDVKEGKNLGFEREDSLADGISLKIKESSNETVSFPSENLKHDGSTTAV